MNEKTAPVAGPSRQPIITHPLLITWFEDLRVEEKSRHTCVGYVADLREVAAFLDGNLEGAVTDDLFRYRRSLLTRNLSVSSRARRIIAMRTFYNWLRIRQGKTASIAQDVRPPKRPETVHRCWTVDQIARFRRVFEEQETECARLVETIGKRNPLNERDPHDQRRAWRKARVQRYSVLRDRAMMEMGLMGLRIGEVVALDINDIRNLEYPDQATILVKRKGPKEQVLPLSADAREALKRWLAKRPDGDSDAVFFRLPFQPSRPRLRYVSIEKIFLRYAKLAGLPLRRGTKFHLLRHSTAQRLADMGTPIQEIQALLGHRTPATTAIYFRVTDKTLRGTVARLNFAVDPNANEKGTFLTDPQEQA